MNPSNCYLCVSFVEVTGNVEFSHNFIVKFLTIKLLDPEGEGRSLKLCYVYFKAHPICFIYLGTTSATGYYVNSLWCDPYLRLEKLDSVFWISRQNRIYVYQSINGSWKSCLFQGKSVFLPHDSIGEIKLFCQ